MKRLLSAAVMLAWWVVSSFAQSAEPTPTLQSLRWEESVFYIATSGKVHINAFTLREPLRLVFDLSPCSLPSHPINLEGDIPAVVAGVRWAQFQEGIVRVVLDLRQEVVHTLNVTANGQEATVALAVRTDSPRLAAPPPPTTAKLLQWRWETTEQEARLHLQFDRRVAVRLQPHREGYTTLVEMPVEVSASANQGWQVKHPLIEEISFASDSRRARATLTIRTTRAASVKVEYHEQQPVLILAVNRPRNAYGKLSEKHLVIDPGHGGKSLGAVGRERDGSVVYEKDIALAIARRVRDLLLKAGARVTMTREDDSAVDLYARPQLANDLGADFFISIHCDSTPKPNSASGTTTYFHASDPDGRALAQAIQKHLAAVTGLPNRGARSDTSIYQSGFAVLRRSQMPAVLIEVAYINHDTDRAKLKDPKFQQRVAEAIVAAIKAYVEDQPSKAAEPQEPSRLTPPSEQDAEKEIPLQIPEPL